MRRGSIVKTNEFGYGIAIEGCYTTKGMSNIFVLHTLESTSRSNIKNDIKTYNLYVTSPYGALTSGDLVAFDKYISCIEFHQMVEIDSKHPEFKDARIIIRKLLSSGIVKRTRLVEKLLNL